MNRAMATMDQGALVMSSAGAFDEMFLDQTTYLVSQCS